jgi:hypothetical protein
VLVTKEEKTKHKRTKDKMETILEREEKNTRKL